MSEPPANPETHSASTRLILLSIVSCVLFLAIDLLGGEGLPIGLVVGISVYFLIPGIILGLWIAGRSSTRSVGLVIGLSLSPGLAAILLYVGLFAGLGLAACHTAFLAVLLGFSLLTARRAPGPRAPGNGGGAFGVTYLAAALMIVLVLLLPMLQLGSRISFHGLFHVAVTNQILDGTIPPTHPTFLGAPNGTYWIYHAFLAQVSRVTHLSPVAASVMLRVFTLPLSVFIIAMLAGRLGMGRSRWLVAIFALLCVNLTGPLLFGHEMVFESGVDRMFRAPASTPSDITDRLLFTRDPKVGGGLDKYLNFTSFGYALLLWSTCLASIGGCIRPGRTRQVTIFLVSAATICMHLPSSLPILLLVPLSAVATIAIRGWPGYRRLAAAMLTGTIPVGLAVLLTAPYWLGVTSSMSEPSPHSGLLKYVVLQPRKLEWSVRSVLGAYLLVLPLLGAGLFLIRRMAPRQARVLLCACGCLVLGVFARLPHGNQYKFILMAAVPAGLSAAFVAGYLLRKTPRLLKALGVTGVVLALCTTVPLLAGHFRATWWSDLASDGTQLTSRATGVYDYLLRNTPVDVVVVQPPVSIDQSRTGALSRRQVYFANDWTNRPGFPGYARRRDLVKAIFQPDADLDTILATVREECARPICLVLPARTLGDRYASIKGAVRTLTGVSLLHADEGGSLFLLPGGSQRTR